MSTIMNPIDAVEAKELFARRLSNRDLSICASCGSYMQIGSQVWACLECGHARGWGFDTPWDSLLKPVLGCQGCGTTTRHAFLGVVGRSL
jgi:hypothetical protein